MTAAAFLIRKPNTKDGREIYNLVRSCGPPLDLNSKYLYFLIGAHFSQTSAVVESGDRMVGFSSAYRLPDEKDRLFIWQLAVRQEARGKGIGQSMLDDILSRPVCRSVRYLEATVTPSNRASKNLFKKLAKRRGVLCREETFLESQHFGETVHEREIRLTIGPFSQ